LHFRVHVPHRLGPFGSAGFQFLYATEPAVNLMVCTMLEYHVLVTLPLWVLSVIFRHLLPVAVTSLLISLGVCAAAGAQAALPGDKRRWWSRPLVAMLFFLQPIARGWARYQGRLSLGPAAAIRPTLDSIALRDSDLPLDEVRYWSEQRMERVDFVKAVLQRLEQQGWPHRSDIGWNEFDVEIYGSRWTKLQLITVAEEHPPGKQLIRCRLRPRWPTHPGSWWTASRKVGRPSPSSSGRLEGVRAPAQPPAIRAPPGRPGSRRPGRSRPARASGRTL
jgi:hypothetical protein